MNKRNKKIFLFMLLTLTIFISQSCLLKAIFPTSSNKGRGSSRTGIKAKNNSPSTLNFGYGRILKSNPIIISGDTNYAAGSDLNTLISPAPVFITNNPKLEAACSSADGSVRITSCYQVLKNNTSAPLVPQDGKWGFDANTHEFLQVHTFAHAAATITFFQNTLNYAYSLANPNGTSGGGKYSTAIGPYFYNNAAFWGDSILTIYSACVQEGTAFFQPSNFTVCFGQDPALSNFVLSQDPDVIYHEVGHSLVKIMMNTRNKIAGLATTIRSDLGNLFYDEGGSINEGLADYFSYILTGGMRDFRKVDEGKKHFSEWALGRFYRASRPLTEDDPLHLSSLSRDADSRLSYPTFLNYDPNNPTEPLEDIHYAGQITSHFLVSLTEELKVACSMDHDSAARAILYAILETLSELGDLTSKATNNPETGTVEDRVNLTQTNANGDAVSVLWHESVNPINYRRFFQTFARYFIKIFSSTAPTITCGSSGTYGQDNLEKLLDKYGLLLFKSYNDNRNGTLGGHSGTLTRVNKTNRQRSLLIPKNYLKMNPNPNTNQAFVFDSQEDMLKIVTGLLANGDIADLSPLIPSELSYNNSNGRVSPGEILGVALNLYNGSNTSMAGVQVLGNDWDHGKMEGTTLKPCRTFIDNFPLETEGAASVNTGTPAVGDCEYITRTNGGETNATTGVKEVLMPICMVQLRTTSDTQWVSQEKFRESISLPKTDCLKGSSSTNDCLIRVIPGADQAVYSKINPKGTWGETLSTVVAPSTTDNNSAAPAPVGPSKQVRMAVPNFQSSNIILMEINPWIPPGTTFDCRFRARFTNCEDCWTDPLLTNASRPSEYFDDFLDYQYSGGKPFQILHLQFTVVD